MSIPVIVEKGTRDRVVANFLDSIGHLQALEGADLGEIVEACEIIGAQIRCALNCSERGLLALAKIILDHANTTGR